MECIQLTLAKYFELARVAAKIELLGAPVICG